MLFLKSIKFYSKTELLHWKHEILVLLILVCQMSWILLLQFDHIS